MNMNVIHTLLIIGSGFILCQSAIANTQCANPAPGTCSFYPDCLEQRTTCGDSGYALGYGLRYCESFLQDVRFTERGVAWRDRVSSCLQRSLVRFTDPLRPAPSCAEIRQKGFQAHVACYTQSDNSICDLYDSLEDIHAILSTIQLSDLLSEEGQQQVVASAKTCLQQLSTTAERQPDAVLAQKKQFWEAVMKNPLYTAKICPKRTPDAD